MSGSHEHASTNTVQTQFFSAVERNDRNLLRELILSNHCDPRFIRNEQQETLLHIASKLGLIDIVRTLVEIYLLCPFVVDQFSFTSCHRACQFNHLHVLSYFLQVSGHTYISEFQLPQVNSQLTQHCLLPVNFILNMLHVAAQSGNVVMTRFTYTLLCYNQIRHLFMVKLNLFLDVFYVLCKVIDPELHYNKRDDDLESFASCCKGGVKLDILKFFWDELTNVSDSLVRVQTGEQVRSILASLLEDAYRLDNSDIANYLTKRKGLSPAHEPSKYYLTCTVKPFDHSDCFRHSYSPLHTAVLCGNISTVKNLMAPTTDLYHLRNHLTTNHGTLLHSACVCGSKDMVILMMQELECDINAQNNHGDTPLHVACEWGWLEIVQYLLEQEDCNVDVLNSHGYSPLTLAIKHNRIKIFELLLTKCSYSSINARTTDTLETPLHFACCNSTEYVLSLLNDDRYSCALDSVDKYGDTPLFNACRLGSVEIVQQLVVRPDCNRSFVNEITKESPAHIACRNNRLDILKLLLTEGISEPLQDVQINCLGKSLLHVACDNDAEEIIDFLINSGICKEFSMDAVEVMQSPLHVACKRGNVNIVKKLLKSGICKSTDIDREGNTTLHYICSRELVDPEMVKIFSQDIETNGMIEKRNVAGDNPLHSTCENNGVQVLHCLSKHLLSLEGINAALHSTNNNGNNPLHLACLLYTSPSPRDATLSRMPSSA